MKPFRRLLFATDFSTASRTAFATALKMAKAVDARLTIVYVMTPIMPVVPEQYLDGATLNRLEAQARQWGSRHLRKLAAAAARAGVDARILLLEGDPVGQIVGAARSERADLIVVGTHGRHGLPKFFLGSVAERVVMMAPCPVVTTRGTK